MRLAEQWSITPSLPVVLQSGGWHSRVPTHCSGTEPHDAEHGQVALATLHIMPKACEATDMLVESATQRCTALG